MSSTNHTPNLGLSQFLGTDKPTWLGDYNSDMDKIDRSVHNLEIGTTSVIAGQISMLTDTVDDLSKHVADSDLKISANTSSISNMNVRLINSENALDALDTREQNHYDTVTGQVDALDTAVSDIQKDVDYFDRNINKIEADTIVNTSSITKLQVRMNNAEIDITNLQDQQGDSSTDIDNLKAEVDTLDIATRQLDTAVKAINREIPVMSASIAANTVKLDSYITATDKRLDDLENDVSELQTEYTTLASTSSTSAARIEALETKTANITDGVAVPFGFGETADNKKGYKNDDGTITAFATQTDIDDIQNDVEGNMNDIVSLQTKTAGITDGMKLPFSFGIDDGGAYGYFKNGEAGITPFITATDVNKIVDIEPLESKVQSLETTTITNTNDIAILETKTANIKGNPTIEANIESAGNGIYTLTDSTITSSAAVKAVIVADGDHTDLNITNIDASIAKTDQIFINSTASTIEFDSSLLVEQDGLNTLLLGNRSSNYESKIKVYNNVAIGSGAKKDLSGEGANAPESFIAIPFGFGIDANGNYGYVKAGADTVTPFLTYDNSIKYSNKPIADIASNLLGFSKTSIPDNCEVYYIDTSNNNSLFWCNGTDFNTKILDAGGSVNVVGDIWKFTNVEAHIDGVGIYKSMPLPPGTPNKVKISAFWIKNGKFGLI